MHALCNHGQEFLKLYKNIEYFTQQGLEKYNDKASKNYFRSTNFHGVSALEPKLLFQNLPHGNALTMHLR